MHTVIPRLIKKASQSTCCFKVAAMGFSKKGELIGLSTNKFRFSKYGGGLHAEELLIKKYKSTLHKIIICRIGRGSVLRPIEPCERCSKLANKYNIRIETVSTEYNEL